MQAILSIKPYSVVSVGWRDSSFRRGWQYPPYEALTGPLAAKSVALVLANCEGHLTVAEALTFEGAALNPLDIPWSSIETCVIRHSEGLWRVGLREDEAINWLDKHWPSRESAAAWAVEQNFQAPVVFGVQCVEEKSP